MSLTRRRCCKGSGFKGIYLGGCLEPKRYAVGSEAIEQNALGIWGVTRRGDSKGGGGDRDGVPAAC